MKILEIKETFIIYKYLIIIIFFKHTHTSVSLTWINCSSNDSAQRVPGPVIKPVMEFIKSLLCQEPGSPIIEVPIEKKKRSCFFLLFQILAPICSEFCFSVYTIEELIITLIKSVWRQKLCQP